MNVLSIDFDFWFPEKPEYDWGHRETPIFLEVVWPSRAISLLAQDVDIRKEMACAESPEPSELKKHLESEKNWNFADDCSVSVAESHASAYYAWEDLSGDVTVYHLDAHHDFGYGSESVESLDCGSWIYHLAKKISIDRVKLVYPGWRENERSAVLNSNADFPPSSVIERMNSVLRGELDISYGVDSLPNDLDIDAVFICRSGCWVPPWFDRQFIDLIHSFYNGNMSIWGWSSLDEIERALPDWSDVEEQARQWREQMNRANQPIGGDPKGSLMGYVPDYDEGVPDD